MLITPSIYLIGFMGSGKSSIGKKLSNLLHFDFVDTDAEIERLTGKSIAQIFDVGEEHLFREQERTLIAELSQRDNIVVATGGGTPCYFDNMQRMNESGLTVYLHANPKILKQRLIKQKSKRPLLQNIPDESLELHIAEMLFQRGHYYCQSKITVEAFNITAKKLMEMIKPSSFSL
ncbi:MAG: shikimate kinase [Bacteroidales bacterium]|nr:shikimate kinase [Bacteroidales bacterium]